MTPDSDKTITRPRRSGRGWKTALSLVGLALLGFNVYLLSKISYIEGAAESQRAKLTDRIVYLEDQLAHREGRSAREIDALRQEIRQSSKVAFSNARSQAKRESERVAKQIELKRLERDEDFAGEIGGVKDAAATNRFDLDRVRANVDGIEGEVATARARLDQTAKTLDETRGDMGRLSGQLGDHATEIEELRRRGERDVLEFTLEESRERSRIGDVIVRLRDANPRKSRYTLEILADDQVIVQKDRYVNEPVEFYPDGLGNAYQIIVVDVSKKGVRGYLVRPKFAEMASK